MYYVDPTGEAWYHWAIAGGLVLAAAVATVITAGGAVPALYAVGSVASGYAAATTASTVAAGAFIGTSVATGTALMVSDYASVETFNNSADWGTVGTVFTGGLLGGSYGYSLSSNIDSANKLNSSKVAKQITSADRVGTALSKNDVYHRAGSYLSESQLSLGKASYITGSDGKQYILFQVEGAVNDIKGMFEFIITPDGNISHQLFTAYQYK